MNEHEVAATMDKSNGNWTVEKFSAMFEDLFRVTLCVSLK